MSRSDEFDGKSDMNTAANAGGVMVTTDDVGTVIIGVTIPSGESVVQDSSAVDAADAEWVDNQGDVWVQGEDGLMHSYETAPFPREHVERKWGPLSLMLGESAMPHIPGRKMEP